MAGADLRGRVSAAYPSYPEGPLARTHFIIGRDDGRTPDVDRATLEAGIAAIVRTWGDQLREAAVGHPVAAALIERYADGFNAAYREAFNIEEALRDMAVIDRLSPERPRLVDLYRMRGAPETRANLKVFALGQAVPLSERVPLLEGLGFRVIDERTYSVLSAGTGGRTIWLHDMTLERQRAARSISRPSIRASRRR